MTNLPNIKSSVKSMRIDAKRRARNVSEKIRMKRAQKLVLAAIAAGDAAKAKELLPAAQKAIDQAAANNTIHKNAAARTESQRGFGLKNSGACHFVRLYFFVRCRREKFYGRIQHDSAHESHCPRSH